MARSKVDKRMARRFGGAGSENITSASVIHRSTLKQKNKPFKAKRKATSSSSVAAGSVVKRPATATAAVLEKKLGRLSVAADKRRDKTAKVKNAKTVELKSGLPRLVAVVPAHPTANVKGFRELFVKQFIAEAIDGHSTNGNSQINNVVSEICSKSGTAVEILTSPLPKWAARTTGQMIQFAVCPNIGVDATNELSPEETHEHICALLDVCKAADIILFLFGDCTVQDAGFGKFGNEFVSLLKQQGLPLVTGVWAQSTDATAKYSSATMTDGDNMNVSNKKAKLANWNLIQRAFATEFGRKSEIFNFSDFMDAAGSCIDSVRTSSPNKLLRHLVGAPLAPLAWREPKRSYLLAESALWVPERNSVVVTGYARGIGGFSPLYPVHLSGIGDVPVRSVGVGSASTAVMAATSGSLELFAPVTSWDTSPGMEEFFRQNIWPQYPTVRPESSVATDGENGFLMSDATVSANDDDMYDDEVDNDKDEIGVVDEDDDDDAIIDSGDEGTSCFGSDDGSDMTSASHAAVQLQERSRVDMEFADEVDTPNDMRASERFRRYRHLENFRNQDWDNEQDDWISCSSGKNKDFSARLWKISPYVKTLTQLNERYLNILTEAAEKIKSTASNQSAALNKIRSDRRGAGVVCLELCLDESFNSTAAGENSSPLSEHVVDQAAFDELRNLIRPGGFFCGSSNEASDAVRWVMLKKPLVLSSLAPMERKVSVQHFSVMKWGDVRHSPVPSKSSFGFQCGFRRWWGGAVFSEPLQAPKGATLISRECRVPALHKLHYHRFLSDSQKLRTVLSTVSRTIAFGGPLILWLKSVSQKIAPEIQERIERFNDERNAQIDQLSGDQQQSTDHRPSDTIKQLEPIRSYTSVGYGDFITTDPTRLIIKRVLITGYPHKIKKKKSTVHRMFNNRKDVEHFSSARLVTKRSKQGRILCPIGTHGVMKCMFSDSIDHNDTVCLPLFKRILPPPPAELLDMN